jgi:hypothetical protein
MVVRPWSRTVVKVVVMAATMCSGVSMPRNARCESDEGQDRPQIAKIAGLTRAIGRAFGRKKAA